MNGVKTYVDPFEVGKPFNGSGVGKVVETKNPNFAVGDILTSRKILAWPSQKYVVFDAETAAKYTKLNKDFPPHLIPATIGWLGMPGLTSYFGLIDRGKPKAGETLVVSGAAGACGSVAGQIGKLLQLRVIGIAGSKDKIDYLLNDLGFDAAVNYKGKTEAEITQELKQLAPNGVDIYYDNVGGSISNAVIPLMNQGGRIPICGQISQYNAPNWNADLPPELQKIVDERKLERGWFLVFNFFAKFDEASDKLVEWAKEGKLKCRETSYDGLENLSTAFLGLFQGDNVGKAVVRVSSL